MRSTKENVGKMDIGFLDIIKQKALEIGSRLVARKTSSTILITAFGMKFKRETETVTTTLLDDERDERQ